MVHMGLSLNKLQCVMKIKKEYVTQCSSVAH